MVQRSSFPNSDASDVRREFQKAAATALETGKVKYSWLNPATLWETKIFCASRERMFSWRQPNEKAISLRTCRITNGMSCRAS
jgi:hypothetical protein